MYFTIQLGLRIEGGFFNCNSWPRIEGGFFKSVEKCLDILKCAPRTAGGPHVVRSVSNSYELVQQRDPWKTYPTQMYYKGLCSLKSIRVGFWGFRNQKVAQL